MEFILIGIVTGFISGMGIGGGTILIPVLTLIMSFSQKIAQGINLLVYIPAAVSALFIYHRSGTINFKTAFRLSIAGVIGAAAGAGLALIFPESVMMKIFGIFLLFLSIQQFFYGKNKNKK